MLAVRIRTDAMHLVQNLASGLLARSESVLALAPPAAPWPLPRLPLAWLGPGRRPFCFPFFSFPFFLPEVTLCSKEFGWREGRQWATILAQALAEFNLTQVGLGSVRRSKSEQLHSPAAVTPPTSNYLFIRVVAERPLLPTDALACTVAAICLRQRTDTKWTHYVNK